VHEAKLIEVVFPHLAGESVERVDRRSDVDAQASSTATSSARCRVAWYESGRSMVTTTLPSTMHPRVVGASELTN
jgi:hypothetical protein